MTKDELQIRATEKLLKARKTTRRVERLTQLLAVAVMRDRVAREEYESARVDAEKAVLASL